jgi:hypothetical protein
MISAYGVFKIYHPVNLHFTSNYDIFKYNSKIKSINRDIFEERNDKLLFEILSSKLDNAEETLKFCVFNSLRNSLWLYDAFEISKECYLNGNKFYSNFKRNIKQDYDVIESIKRSKQIQFSEISNPTRSGNKPPIVQLLLKNNISIECCCLLNSKLNFTDTWESCLDPLVQDYKTKICKYTNFVLKFNRTNG